MMDPGQLADALTSARAYRAATPVSDAVRLVCEASGTHFDPAIVELVARLHAEEDLLPSGWES